MEGDSFVVPAQLPNRWPACGPPKQFQGYPQDMQSSQVTATSRSSNYSSKYQNHYNNSYNGGYMSEDATFSSEYSNQFFAHHQGGPARRQRQWHHYASAYATQQRKPITCGPCNRTFYSQQRMDEHLKDHVECPFPECKLSAHIKVIDQHINNQHMLVNFEALQIDDETWIAERKKRFPTSQRAELRRAEQMEKLKRGEKLGFSKKPFDNKKSDNKFKKGKNGVQKGPAAEKKAEQKEPCSSTKDVSVTSSEVKSKFNSRFRKQKQKRDERPPGPRKPSIEVDLFESSDEEVYGVCHFRGTRHFYESTGEMNYFSANHINRNSVESDIAISDEEEWETENKDGSTNTGALVLGGALGSLMGAYTDSEEEENADPLALISSALAEKTNSSLVMPSQDVKNMAAEKKGNTQNNDELEHKARARRRPRVHKKGKGPANTKKPPTRKRRSLLERLLQADIIHERNIILQCVRFIVENNFFDENVKCTKNEEQTGFQEIQTLMLENEKIVNTEVKTEDSSVNGCDCVNEVNEETNMITECVDSKDTKVKSLDSGEAVMHNSVGVAEKETAESIGDSSQLEDSSIKSKITVKSDHCESCAEGISSSYHQADENRCGNAKIAKEVTFDKPSNTSLVIEGTNEITGNLCKRSVDVDDEVSTSGVEAKKLKVEDSKT